MFFKTIPGKEDEKLRLIHQVKEDRIPHAQLFIGREGSANLTMALSFVSYLYCQNKKEDDSCGECPACKLTHKMIHPDVHFSFPVVKSESKKGKIPPAMTFSPNGETSSSKRLFSLFTTGNKPSRHKPPNPTSTPKNATTSFRNSLFSRFLMGQKCS